MWGENPQRAIKGGQKKEKFGSEEKWKERVKESWGGKQQCTNTGQHRHVFVERLTAAATAQMFLLNGIPVQVLS